MPNIDFNKIKFIKYSPLFVPLIKESKFCCGNTELDSFLKEELESHRTFMFTQSTLIIYEEKRIIGYFSLQADAIKLSDEERKVFEAKGFGYRTFPAVKIGRLAIDKEFARGGIGTLALQVITGIVRANHENIASRFITVDSKKTREALDFYMKKHNFVENEVYNKNPDRETVSLRYDLYNPPK